MSTNKQRSSKSPIQKDEAGWWQKAIKAFGIEAPILLIVGVLIGIILAYVFMMSKPDLFIQPAISYAVRETVSAQSLTQEQNVTITPSVVSPTTTIQARTILTSTIVTNTQNLAKEDYMLHGEEVVYDDFSKRSSSWSEGSSGTNRVGYENDTYYLELNNPDSYFSALLLSYSQEIMSLENFAVQVDLLGPFNTNWDQKQGIVFGYKLDRSGTSYAFDLTYDGTCRLVRRIDGGVWEVISTSKFPDFDKNSTHTLSVVVTNSQEFSGYVNKQLCLTKSIEYSPGSTGVVGKILHGSGKLFFDNFYVFNIP